MLDFLTLHIKFSEFLVDFSLYFEYDMKHNKLMLFFSNIIGGERMNTGDTVFMFVATVMVMLMTPGLALFLWRYGSQ